MMFCMRVKPLKFVAYIFANEKYIMINVRDKTKYKGIQDQCNLKQYLLTAVEYKSAGKKLEKERQKNVEENNK